MKDIQFKSALEFLRRIPAINPSLGYGSENGMWWIKFEIDIEHPLAWHTVQELGHILNYLSIHERLPSRFYPVSPPPYMNGGPYDFLSWVIENEDETFTPNKLKEWLEGRMPKPVDDLEQWNLDDE